MVDENPGPQTQNPGPQTLNPGPQTLNPGPQTLKPTRFPGAEDVQRGPAATEGEAHQGHERARHAPPGRRRLREQGLQPGAWHATTARTFLTSLQQRPPELPRVPPRLSHQPLRY